LSYGISIRELQRHRLRNRSIDIPVVVTLHDPNDGSIVIDGGYAYVGTLCARNHIPVVAAIIIAIVIANISAVSIAHVTGLDSI
jgi:hypothetical protein